MEQEMYTEPPDSKVGSVYSRTNFEKETNRIEFEQHKYVETA